MSDVAVGYSRTMLRNFSSEWFPNTSDALRTRDKLRLDGAIPAAGFVPRLPITLELQRDAFESGRSNLAATARVSSYVARTAITNQVTWQSMSGVESAVGTLQLSRRVGDIGLSGQLGYTLSPAAKVDTIAITGDTRLGVGYQVNLGLFRTIASRETLLTASLNKSLGSYAMGLTGSYSSRGELALNGTYFGFLA